jgi:hypothetical protein
MQSREIESLKMQGLPLSGTWNRTSRIEWFTMAGNALYAERQRGTYDLARKNEPGCGFLAASGRTTFSEKLDGEECRE